MKIARVTPAELAASAVEFHALLRDAVDHGASIGFTLPLAEAEVAEYWRKVGADVAAGTRVLPAITSTSIRARNSGSQASRRTAPTGIGQARDPSR